MKAIPTRTGIHDALERMDALLDPSRGLLNLPPGSATAKACQHDMATIRAAVDRNAGVTEADVRLEIEHVLHTLDGGRMMEMDGDRIVATVMGLVQRASPAAGLAAPAGEPPPFTGYWRGGNGVISCGTLRIFSENFDTNPANHVKAAIVKWVCDTLNAAQQPGVAAGHDASSHADVTCVPATAPAPFHPPLHLVSHIASLIAADLLGQSKEEDRQLVALRLVELLVRANARPCCPPPADRTEVQERQQLGCAHCGTGIYYAAPRHQ